MDKHNIISVIMQVYVGLRVYFVMSHMMIYYVLISSILLNICETPDCIVQVRTV